ncbi:MAG: hypothetical protein SZ59_C0001G0061 [candidate division TM6 bacterium GW2011_GWF2_28_16]|nr:MAG: hypothetical protein SZ59_C0001G0061 [candidate division TM6 bacterium GW2011_GWF2_28_16]
MFLFFLKRFYKSFFINLLILIFILSSSDIFLRLPVISDFTAGLKVFLLMVPLMAQFAIPIASSLAVQMSLGNLYVEDEIILIYYFKSARLTLFKSILFFSLSILTFYVPIVTKYAPQSYKNGKQLILDLAQKHFSSLYPGKFHNISSNFAIYFEKQEKNNSDIKFIKLLLLFKEKNGEQFIINANTGFLANNILLLNNGSIQNIALNHAYISNFEKTEINLTQFLDSQEKLFDYKDLKFYKYSELNYTNNINYINILIEKHKRIAQILWQLFMPFFAIFLIMFFAKNKSNLLISIFLSGFLFLSSYILLNLVKTLAFLGQTAIIFFYLPLIIFFIIFFYFYNKKVN